MKKNTCAKVTSNRNACACANYKPIVQGIYSAVLVLAAVRRIGECLISKIQRMCVDHKPIVQIISAAFLILT